MDTGGPIRVETLPLPTIFIVTSSAQQPLLLASLSARASLSPAWTCAWTCAVASQLPDSILWPTGPFSQLEPRALRETQIRQPHSPTPNPAMAPYCLQDSVGCPAPSPSLPQAAVGLLSLLSSRARHPCLPPRPPSPCSRPRPSLWLLSISEDPGQPLPPGGRSELRPIAVSSGLPARHRPGHTGWHCLCFRLHQELPEPCLGPTRLGPPAGAGLG